MVYDARTKIELRGYKCEGNKKFLHVISGSNYTIIRFCQTGACSQYNRYEV